MQNIAFNGLTSTLKGNIYKSSTIHRLAYCFPNSRGSVGSLPIEWLNQISVSERKTFIKDCYKIFGEIIDIQRKKLFFANRKCSKLLKEFLINNGVIQESDKLRFRYAGYGDFADVVSFNVAQKRYALKIFTKQSFLQAITNKFGNCAEQNNALYIGANENSDWVRFYFGNVIDGYMVTKYIDDKTPLPRKKIKLSDIGLEFLDYDFKNIKNNINIDYGGHQVLKDFPIGNKVAMWTIKRLKKLSPEKRTEEIEKIIANKKVPNYYDRIIGVKYIQSRVIPMDAELNSQKRGFWRSFVNAFLSMYKD